MGDHQSLAVEFLSDINFVRGTVSHYPIFRRLHKFPLLFLVALSVVCLSAPATTNIVVSGDDFQQKINASSPGDTLLVESGAYAGNLNFTKPLTIVNSGGGQIQFTGTATIQSTGSVAISQAQFSGPLRLQTNGLLALSNCVCSSITTIASGNFQGFDSQLASLSASGGRIALSRCNVSAEINITNTAFNAFRVTTLGNIFATAPIGAKAPFTTTQSYLRAITLVGCKTYIAYNSVLATEVGAQLLAFTDCETVLSGNLIYREGARVEDGSVSMVTATRGIFKAYNNRMTLYGDNWAQRAFYLYGFTLSGTTGEVANNSIYLDGNGAYHISDSEIGVFITAGGGPLEIRANAIFAVIAPSPDTYPLTIGVLRDGTQSVDALFCCIYSQNGPALSGLSGTNCVFASPQFTGAYEATLSPDNLWHLPSPGSPCLNAGPPDAIYNNLDGTRNTIGYSGGPYWLPSNYTNDFPVIQFQSPPSQAIPVGSNITFSAMAAGEAPLKYQWYLKDEYVIGATNAMLFISNAQPSNAGAYFVVVSNSFGSVTSKVATLAVETTFTKITNGVLTTTKLYSVAWGDYDNDGWPDLSGLFIPQYTGDNVLLHNTNGSFTVVTNAQWANEGATTLSVAWGDYDNDGFTDLFAAGSGGNLGHLYHNNGNGTFAQVAAWGGQGDVGVGFTAAWADYDRDGYLDLFVANEASASSVNYLYHNNGNGTFTRILSGAIATDTAASGCGVWGDYDNDGWPDLFVANFGGVSFLYHNAGDGTFTRIMAGAIASDSGLTSAGSWMDYDNDGYLDLFVAVDQHQGNRLYHNNRDGTFTRINSPEETGGNSVGAAWGDIDNDGNVDLFVPNYYGDSQGNFLFLNNGAGNFLKATNNVIGGDGGDSYGAAWADFNRDGFLDLVVGNGGGANAFVYRNNGSSNSWFSVRCRGTTSNRDAIGAKVRVTATINGSSRSQMREIGGLSSYASQNEPAQHFGLGDSTNIALLRIEWPSGKVQQFTNVAPRQFLTIQEQTVLYFSVNGPGTFTYSPVQNNYFVGDTLTVTATPSRYHRFVQWSDGNTNAVRNYAVGLSNVLTAIFTNIVDVEALPLRVWDTTAGGTNLDQVLVVRETEDGGFIAGGSSSSPASGNKTTPNYGGRDFWIVRLDSAGRKLWEKNYGGSGNDDLESLEITSDGGFIVGGSTDSGISGNKTSGLFGGTDYWVLRLDPSGEKVWERVYGGSASDALKSVQPTADGGFIFAGDSSSAPGGTKTAPNFGQTDVWLIRTDSAGNVIWDRSFGGTDYELMLNLSLLRNGGFVVSAMSASPPGGNKTSPAYGRYDAWVIRFDAGGYEKWQTSLGGDGHDYLYRVNETAVGDLILGGGSASSPGAEKSSPLYGPFFNPDPFVGDAWVVRLNAGGQRLWDSSFGGSASDSARDLVLSGDGGCVFAGSSLSGADGNKSTTNHGTGDGWLGKVNGAGNKQWDFSVGGTNGDDFISLCRTGDDFVAGGRSGSEPGGNKVSPAFGQGDFWLVKLSERIAPIGTPVLLVNGFYSPTSAFAFPATNSVQLTLQSSFPNGSIFYTLDGTQPDPGSASYDGSPIMLSNSTTVRAVAYDEAFAESQEADPVTVTFIPVYSVSATTAGGGSISLSPTNDLYLSNSVVTLTATPSSGWVFLNWKGDSTITNSLLNLTFDRSKTVQAVFGTLVSNTISPAGFGTVTREPAQGPYPYGSTVRIAALPAAGKYFIRWTGAANGLSNSPINFSVTITNANASTLFGTLPANTFALTTLINGNGAVTKDPQLQNYANNQIVSLTATPDSGYAFIGWSGDASGLANPLNVTMTTNKTITASFSTTVPPSNAPPSITITNPISGAAFTQPANITINATASDSDGSAVRVEFFNGTNLLGAVSNAPFNFIWTNAPLGTNILTAVVTDNGGLSATSALVSVMVSLPPMGNPVFSLSSSTYPIQENGGSVTVTILKNLNSLAGTVNYSTADGSAVAFSGGVGDYQATSGSLSFTNGELSKTVSIPIINDFAYEGNQAFSFLLSVSGGSASLGSPSGATLTIVDDDPPASTNSLLDFAFPSAVPPHNGQLRVTTEPSIAAGQWRLLWETAWRNSGDSIGGLPTGNYEVEFRPAGGFLQPPNTTNPVVAGSLNSVTNTYAVSGDPQFGSLTVNIEPSAVANALNPAARGQWRLQGAAIWNESGAVISNLLAGHQIVEFKSIADWVTPAPRLVFVGPDQLNTIGVTYLVAGASSSAPPTVKQFGEATSPAFGFPYAYNGQLLSEIGYGSGCVVKRRVVLTAAHVVFNDTTLSFVSNVRWFFQRYAGEYEPPAQTPRGWYAFSGYAAARTNDNSPGVSSPASQNLDVAALYFAEDAGRGGASGYLVSEPGATEWLQASALKMLVGYPVEVVSDINRGRLFATSSGNIPFTPVTNRVFSTTAINGYPGMSGGPLCVQFTNGAYYPAAVFLGGSAETIVRGIDGAVADLINRADVTANTGDNNTGGGVITIIPGSLGGTGVGYLQVKVGPAAAVSAGAGWRLSGDASYSSNPNFTRAVNSGGGFSIEFKSINGWNVPVTRSVVVPIGQSTVIDASYSVVPPLLAFVPQLGLGVTGTTGARYRLEYRGSLSSGTWLPLRTNTLGAGFNLLLPWPPTNGSAAFYRSVWLP